MKKINSLIVFSSIFLSFATHAQTAAEEFQTLLNLLDPSGNTPKSEMLKQAEKVRDNYPGTPEAYQAKIMADNLRDTLTKVDTQSIFDEDISKRQPPTKADITNYYEDPISDYKFYRHAGLPETFYPIEITFKTNSKKASFYLGLNYKGESWIFMRSAQIRCGEKVFDLSFRYDDVYRDTLYKGVVESVDLPLTGKNLAAAQCLATNPDKKFIRLSGKYTDTTKLSTVASNTLKDMLYVTKNWRKFID